jgi:hypothetical protein
MVPPVRWYHFLSVWMFILSVLYPLHGISTYPLLLLSTVGCIEAFRDNIFEKKLIVLALHLLPFLWIPYELSTTTFTFTLTIIILYLVFIQTLGETPYNIYMTSLSEKHKTIQEFIYERIGVII